MSNSNRKYLSHTRRERERERDKSLVPYHSSGHPVRLFKFFHLLIKDFLVSIRNALDSKPSEYYVIKRSKLLFLKNNKSSDVMMTRIE